MSIKCDMKPYSIFLQQNGTYFLNNLHTMYIVFTFLCAVFCNCHHPLGFVKGEEFRDCWSRNNGVSKEGSVWRLFIGYVFKKCLYRKCKQTATVSFMQCKMLTIDVSCFM
jgi:hypothetical protein